MTQSGVSLSTLQKWLRRDAVAPGTHSRFAHRYSPEERRAAVEAFVKSGGSHGDVAKLWGCSPSSLALGFGVTATKGLEARVSEHKPGRP